jgi:hypothetical protein
MVLNPGQKTTLSMQFMMHGDMGGITISGICPRTIPQADKTLTVLSNWVP